jgi:PIN domain nuclease of toxin-antitoxin system
LAKTGNATIIVPAIAVAELYFLSVKLQQPFIPSELLDALASVSGLELSSLGREHLKRLDELHEIPEMHDRLIAAESFVSGSPVVTRDEVLTNSARVETVW